jgi:Protein of unknown function (DUF2637)
VTARQPAPVTRRHDGPAGLATAADRWLRRFLAVVLGAMTLVTCCVGALAFYTSFEAIRAYAERSQGITPQHAWVVPLLVDSFIVVATFADLWLSTRPTRSWLEVAAPKALLAGAALVSFVLNIAHAGHADWAARGVAAIPPAALLLSVELVLMIVRRAAGARTIRLAAPAGAAAEQVAAMQPAGSGRSAAAPPAPPARHGPGRHTPPARRQPGQADGPRRRALAVLQQDPGISGGRLGRAVGMSERWGRNVRPALVAELAASSGTSPQSGNGDSDHAAEVLALPAAASGDGSDAPA